MCGRERNCTSLPPPVCASGKTGVLRSGKLRAAVNFRQSGDFPAAKNRSTSEMRIVTLVTRGCEVAD